MVKIIGAIMTLSAIIIMFYGSVLIVQREMNMFSSADFLLMSLTLLTCGKFFYGIANASNGKNSSEK
jgi:hypothetical protein